MIRSYNHLADVTSTVLQTYRPPWWYEASTDSQITSYAGCWTMWLSTNACQHRGVRARRCDAGVQFNFRASQRREPPALVRRRSRAPSSTPDLCDGGGLRCVGAGLRCVGSGLRWLGGGLRLVGGGLRCDDATKQLDARCTTHRLLSGFQIVS